MKTLALLVSLISFSAFAQTAPLQGSTRFNVDVKLVCMPIAEAAAELERRKMKLQLVSHNTDWKNASVELFMSGDRFAVFVATQKDACILAEGTLANI